MADVAAETKKPQASPEKEVEKKEKVAHKEEQPVENGKDIENGAENGSEIDSKTEVENGIEKEDEKEDDKEQENGVSIEADESSENVPLKRKSEGGADAPDSAVTDGVSPKKKAKLDESSVENGQEEESVA